MGRAGPVAVNGFGGHADIVSVSWGDHLTFGEGDGRLGTPEALGLRLAVWRDDLGAAADDLTGVREDERRASASGLVERDDAAFHARQ